MNLEQAIPTQPPPPEPIDHQKPRRPFFERRSGRVLLYSAMSLFGAVLLVFGYFSFKFVPKINKRLEAGPFSGSVNIFSAPRSVAVGDMIGEEDVLTRLRRAGYTTSRGNTVG